MSLYQTGLQVYWKMFFIILKKQTYLGSFLSKKEIKIYYIALAIAIVIASEDE